MPFGQAATASSEETDDRRTPKLAQGFRAPTVRPARWLVHAAARSRRARLSVAGTASTLTRTSASARRFPPPWSVDETAPCFTRDANKQALAFVYCEDEPGRRATAKLLTRDEARRIAVNIAKLPVLPRKPQRPCSGVRRSVLRAQCRSPFAFQLRLIRINPMSAALSMSI